MAEPDITVDKDAEENGLGNMVAELLRANVATSSYKGRVFSRMKGSVGLDATDAEVKVTLVFDRGRCVVHDGLLEGTAVTVSADSDSIIELSNVRLGPSERKSEIEDRAGRRREGAPGRHPDPGPPPPPGHPDAPRDRPLGELTGVRPARQPGRFSLAAASRSRFRAKTGRRGSPRLVAISTALS